MDNVSLKSFRMTFILILEWKSYILNEAATLKVELLFLIQNNEAN